MPMDEKEKRCFAVARAALEEMRQQTGFTDGRILSETRLHSEGPMIADIAAQKFARCMNELAQPATFA